MTIICCISCAEAIVLVVRSIRLIQFEGCDCEKEAFRCGLRCTPRLVPVYRVASRGVQGNGKRRSRLIETERLCDEWN